jgi:L-rhamnose isomerase
MRWDSDHVVLFDGETQAIMREIHRAHAWNNVSIALDFFDASINRIAAWVLGSRNALKSVLYALLEPIKQIRKQNKREGWPDGLHGRRGKKTFPFGGCMERVCRREDVPEGTSWLKDIREYEQKVLLNRGG